MYSTIRIVCIAFVLIFVSCEKNNRILENIAPKEVISLPTKQTYNNGFYYGQHFPNGESAVDYIYSDHGMWKPVDSIEYKWNYYKRYGNPQHPHNLDSLINYANGIHYTTCKDANGYLLFDFDHSDELEEKGYGFAFHEHNGKGEKGMIKGNPFTQFWFDDNWLARFMAQTYNRPLPSGLWEPNDFVRWRMLAGDTSYWEDKGLYAVDLLALEGLRAIALQQYDKALSRFNDILDKSNYYFNSNNREYEYPDIKENYHLGLTMILLSHLIDSPENRVDMLQHYMSIRSRILSTQQKQGDWMGWRSEEGPQHLINTESIAVNTLALGSKADYTFETSHFPMRHEDKNYFVRPYNAISAVTEFSSPGFISYGPNIDLPKGNYEVEFLIRTTPINQEVIADFSITNDIITYAFDSLLGKDIETEHFDKWMRKKIRFTLAEDATNIEFKTYWRGNTNMDIASIRLRKM